MTQSIAQDQIRSQIESETMRRPEPTMRDPSSVLAHRLFQPAKDKPLVSEQGGAVRALPVLRVFQGEKIPFENAMELVSHTIGYNVRYAKGVDKKALVMFGPRTEQLNGQLETIGHQAHAVIMAFPESRLLMVWPSHALHALKVMPLVSHPHPAPHPKTMWVIYPNQSMGKNLARWGHEVGYKVLWSGGEWRPSVRSVFHGTFQQAVNSLIEAASAQGLSLTANFYSNNFLVVSNKAQVNQ